MTSRAASSAGRRSGKRARGKPASGAEPSSRSRGAAAGRTTASRRRTASARSNGPEGGRKGAGGDRGGAGTSRGGRAGKAVGGDASRRGLRIAWRVASWGLLFALLGAIAGVGGLAALFGIYGADADLPDVRALRQHRPKQVTRVLASDGKTLLGEIYDERRTVVGYDRFPKVLIDAVVSAEDARFFQHTGLNVWGMVRAFFANLQAGRYAQGGSTITQQVVKTFFLSPERTLRRKVQEVILARRLEQTLTKEQILELYLNQIYFGHGRYGVQEASRFYFDKDVSDIGLPEASILAGLPQGPERLSPFKHPERARARQRYVLGQMVKTGSTTQAQADRVASARLPLASHAGRDESPAPEFVTLVTRRLTARYGRETLSRLGLSVVTTCDLSLQRAARASLREGLRALDRRQGVMRFGRPPRGKRLARLRAKLSKGQPARPKPGRVYRGIVTRLDDATHTATVSLGRATGILDLRREPRYNPARLPPSKLLMRNVVLRVTPTGPPAKKGGPLPLRLAQGPQGALVVLDPSTGEVRAMVGAYEARVGDFNRALRAVRQPGSTFKPIVYAAALEDGKITTTSRLPDAPHPCENWLRIRRRGTKQYRGQLTVREAMTRSVNSIACRVYERVGNARVRDLARRLGISSELTEHLSLALGASGVRPSEMAGAFSAFAHGGRRLPPRFVRRMDALPVEQPPPVQAIRPETAYVVTSLLRSVIRRGTGVRARRIGRPAAGKTGTSNRNRDAWFVGYTPELVAAVWVGHDDFHPLGPRETGGRAAAPIWASFMKRALRGKKKRDFDRPPEIAVRFVEPESGKVVPDGTKGAHPEFFLPGTAPDPPPATAAPEVEAGEHVLQDD